MSREILVKSAIFTLLFGVISFLGPAEIKGQAGASGTITATVSLTWSF
jgi:hypothetical protein